MLSDLRALEDELNRALTDKLDSLRYDLTLAAQRLTRESPLRKVRGNRQYLDSIETRLAQSLVTSVRLRRMRHSSLSAQLRSLSPYAILERGYAILYGKDGGQISSVRQAAAGDRITAQLNDGRIEADVRNTFEQPADGE